jgi:hypothetical protein
MIHSFIQKMNSEQFIDVSDDLDLSYRIVTLDILARHTSLPLLTRDKIAEALVKRFTEATPTVKKLLRNLPLPPKDHDAFFKAHVQDFLEDLEYLQFVNQHRGFWQITVKGQEFVQKIVVIRR